MSVKESVLEELRQKQGTFISGGRLSEDLGVSRAAVWKGIRALREEGWRIEAVTGRGYCLQMGGAGISAGEIRTFLPGRYRRNGLYVYDVLDSTNNRARQIAVGALPDPAAWEASAEGASAETASALAETAGQGEGGRPAGLHGTTVLALQQTAGKGRLGRGFFSPREGIYLSIIVKPRFDLSRSVLVTVAAAAAVAEAIDAVCGQAEETMIKWVNDIYLGTGKVCGILTEGITDFESGQIDHLVIGIGINTSLEGFPEDLQRRAGAVEGDYSRSHLAAEIIRRVLDYLEKIEDRTFMEVYRRKSLLIGREVKVYRGIYRTDPEEDLNGRPARVLGISEDGGLEVMYTDGSRQTLTTGEVSVRLS